MHTENWNIIKHSLFSLVVNSWEWKVIWLKNWRYLVERRCCTRRACKFERTLTRPLCDRPSASWI